MNSLAIVGFNFDVLTALILTSITTALVTVFCYFIVSWVPWHTGSWYRAELYQERDGKYFLVSTKRVNLGRQSFTLGKEYQFIVPTPAPVVFYFNGRPVLHYLYNKARPRHMTIKDAKGNTITGQPPETAALVDPPNLRKPNDKNKENKDKLPDSESRSVNLFMRRNAVKQMIEGTRGTNLGAAVPIIILAAGLGLMVGYIVFQTIHPGLVPAPPIGYYYKAVPIPTNSTGVTTVIH